jgi:hypothetical protein
LWGGGEEPETLVEEWAEPCETSGLGADGGGGLDNGRGGLDDGGGGLDDGGGGLDDGGRGLTADEDGGTPPGGGGFARDAAGGGGLPGGGGLALTSPDGFGGGGLDPPRPREAGETEEVTGSTGGGFEPLHWRGGIGRIIRGGQRNAKMESNCPS